MGHRIGIIGGDGIGPEVVAEAMKAIDAAGVAYTPVSFDLGGERYLRDGEILPDDDLAAIRTCDAVMLGAVGTPDVAPGVIERGLLLRLRFELDLYANVRPFTAGPSTLNDGVDMVVIRENTEGVYAGEGGFLRHGNAPRDRDAGVGEHALRRRALHPLRVRPGEVARAQARHPRAQDERAARSPATSGTARSRSSPRSTPTSTPATTTSTPRASTSCRTRAATTSSSPTTCSATSSPTSAARSPAASGGRRRRTSTPTAPDRRCSSRCTARRPTSRAPGRPIPAPRSSPPR